MVDTEVVAGLAIGYFGSQFLGNFVENKVKPDILDASTSQDKMIAGVANDGSKAALAYGAYKMGTTSPFMKNIAWGSALAAVIDAGWRYSHNGVPYGYKPFNIPLLGDLNEIIAGPNSGSENIRIMDACSDARAAADRACAPKTPTPAPAPAPATSGSACDKAKTDLSTYTSWASNVCAGPTGKDYGRCQQARDQVAGKQAIVDRTCAVPPKPVPVTSACTKAKADVSTYTSWANNVCAGPTGKDYGRCQQARDQVAGKQKIANQVCGRLSMSYTDTDSVEDILMTGYELLAAPPMSPAKRQAICDSIKADALTTNRSYTAQEMEMCTGLLDGYHLQGYETPIPGTSPGDITPSDDVSAPSQDEYMPSAIPDRKSRFSFMEEKSAKQFGFALGSPISGREKYFGMKT